MNFFVFKSLCGFPRVVREMVVRRVKKLLKEIEDAYIWDLFISLVYIYEVIKKLTLVH